MQTTNTEASDSTFRPALQLMSGRAAAFVVTFFIPVLLVRIFSREEIGTYKHIFLIISTLFGIGQIGMAECLYYFLPAFPEHVGRFVANSLMMLAITGAACFGGLVLFSSRIANSLNDPAMTKYMALTAAYLTLMLAGCALETVMVACRQYRWATFCYVGSDLVRGFLFIVPALIFRSLTVLMIGGVLFCAIRVVALIAYVRKECRSDLRVDAALLKRQLGYALPFALAVVVDTIQSNYHSFAVSHYFDLATFAIYSIGCLQIPLVDFMATPASNVMMVQMGGEIREGRPGRLLPIWHDTTRKLALVFFPMVGLLIVNAYNLITFLFTKRYEASVPIFMVWSLSIVFAVLQTDSVLRVFAKTRFLVVMNLTRLIAIVALMSWSLRTFHLVGAVMVTLAGILIAKTMALVRIQQLMNCGIQRLLPWKNLGGVALVAMIAAIPAAFCNELGLAPLYALPICGTLYLLAYGVMLSVFNLLSEGEKNAITTLIGRYGRVAQAR